GGAPLFMRVGNRNDTPQSAISYSAAETLYPGLGAPSEIFAALTGLFTPGAPLSPASYQAVRGKSILDLVRDDLDTPERFEMSQEDRNKLEAWKALLRDTGGVIASARCDAALAEQLGVTSATIDAAESVSEGDVLATKIEGTELDGADLYSNLAVLAAACGAHPARPLSPEATARTPATQAVCRRSTSSSPPGRIRRWPTHPSTNTSAPS